MKIELRRVEFLPKVLEPNVLYVSEKYQTAAHLCACGCGEKIRTPLGPTEWTVTEDAGGPSLRPSIGSWQRPCRSHYVISNGGIRWASQWSEAQVKRGRQYEQEKREAYFAARKRVGWWIELWQWLRGLFGRK